MFNISDLKQKQARKTFWLGTAVAESEVTKYNKNSIFVSLPKVVENRGWDTAASLIQQGLQVNSHGTASTEWDIYLNVAPMELFYDKKRKAIYFTSKHDGKTVIHEIREGI